MSDEETDLDWLIKNHPEFEDDYRFCEKVAKLLECDEYGGDITNPKPDNLLKARFAALEIKP